VFKPITKSSTHIERPEDIAYHLRNALIKTVSGRPGPVHLDIPIDVAEAAVDDSQLDLLKFATEGPLMTPYGRPAPERQAIEAACELLARAERPTIMVGGGVLSSGAEQELQRLAELIQAPVTTSQTSRGAVPEDHPLGLGVSGQNGNRSAERAVAEADVILVVGCRLSDLQTKDWTLLSHETKIIHVDIDANEMGHNYPPDVPIVADAKVTLAAILHELQAMRAQPAAGAASRTAELKKTWQADLDAYFDVKPGNSIPAPLIARTVMKLRQRDAIFTYGAGGNTAHANKIPILEPRTHLKAIGSAAMGFGFPAALGAKLAYPDRQVVCMLGDGDFLMTGQDLETAVRAGLNPIVVIFNNMGLGFTRPHGNPDFAKFADCFDAAGAQVRTVEEMEAAFSRFAQGGRPAIIDAIQERPAPVK
jgi:acetolactate synthase-1/2/3 large subunit